MDTTKSGNLNTGHEFRNMTLEELEQRRESSADGQSSRDQRWAFVLGKDLAAYLALTESERWELKRDTTRAEFENHKGRTDPGALRARLYRRRTLAARGISEVTVTDPRVGGHSPPYDGSTRRRAVIKATRFGRALSRTHCHDKQTSLDGKSGSKWQCFANFGATYIGLERGFFIDTTYYRKIVYIKCTAPFNAASKVAVTGCLCHGPATAVFQASWRPMPRRFGTVGKSSA